MNGGRMEYTFLWFIEKYSYCWHKNGEILGSPVFTTDELMGTSWWIGVYPRGESAENRGFLSLFLVRNSIDDGPEKISLNYEISILTAEGWSLRAIESKFAFKKSVADGWPKFLGRNLVPQDILTVRCRIWRGNGKLQKVAPICTRSRIAVENISFLHAMENFSFLDQNKKNMLEIRSHAVKGCVVSSSLYFVDDVYGGGIIVRTTASNSNYILCKQKISLIGASGNIIACVDSDNRFDDERKDIQTQVLSLTRQVILNKKSEYLAGDKLTLLCECIFSIRQEFYDRGEYQHGILTAVVKQASNLISIKKEGNTVKKTSAYPGALEEIKTLYMNQRFTDVRLKTKTKSFFAHKIILCARSPVFEATMANDTRGEQNSCIQVDDLADDIVERLLLFLYSDSTENLQWNTATQLYYAGNKYQVGKLRAVCSSFLVKHLSATNASELLVLADTHGDNELKKLVEDFILEHEKEVFGSKEWEGLIESNPELTSKTMHLKYKR